MDIDDEVNIIASMTLSTPQSPKFQPHVESAVLPDHVITQTSTTLEQSPIADEMNVDDHLCNALQSIHISPVKSETEQFEE